MSDLPPVGRLKKALIEHLTDTIENGAVVEIVDKETGEVEAARVTCPANVLAVAAKVVKDFHEESGPSAGEKDLSDLVNNYKLRKAGAQPSAH